MGSSSSRNNESTIGGQQSTKKRNIDLSKFPARVDNVNIGGLQRTHDDYINRAVRNLFKAKTFNEVVLEVKTSVKQLEELGIFKSVRARIDVSSGDKASENGYEVFFDGVELKRMTGKVGTEIGQNEGAISTELSSPNIFGRGESLGIHASYSNHKTTDINIKFTKPLYHTFIGDLKPDTSITLSKYSAEFPWSKYRTENFSVTLGSTFLLPAFVHHNFEYEASIKEINVTAKQVPMFLRKHSGPRLGTVLRHICTIDERDSSIFPTRGIFLRTTNEYAGLSGGNIGYISNNSHAELNVPLFAGLSAQFCARVGIIKQPKMAPEIPISNLFILGGPQTLRGYMMAGAGEHADGVATGANTYIAGAAHLWSPLPFFSRKGFANLFRVHLFMNCGKTNALTVDASNLASSFGVGLAFRLGERARIEFNYCEPLTKKNLQYFHKGFQFGIGYDFI